MKTMLLTIIVLISLGSVSASVINVPIDASTIQAGIDAAVDGDTVLVSAGTYLENINYNSKSISVISTDGPDSTIIDGDENGAVVLMLNDIDDTALLEGFTITNGSGWLYNHSVYIGAGISIRYNCSPTLRNLIVTDNHTTGADDAGGGIAIGGNSNPLIENVVISNNTSDWGGGISIVGSHPTLKNVEFFGNIASTTGGAAYIGNSSNPVLQSVTLHDNSATYYGGAVFIHDNSFPVFNQVTMTRNMAGTGAGAIIVNHASTAYIINSILWSNIPNQIELNGDTSYDPASVCVAYSDVQGGEDAVWLGTGSVDWREGNINQDPLFVSPGRSDFSLSPLSPCIDTGIDIFTFTSTCAIDMGLNEYCGCAPDMGAFEALTPPALITVPDDYLTIQSAIDAALHSDTVLVSDGTYVENIDFLGKDVVVLSVNGPEVTTIDGNADGSVVTMVSGEENAILDGFTITNGTGFENEFGHYIAGGIACRNISSPTLRNLIVEDNLVMGDSATGGGIVCSYGADVLLEDVIIRNNEAAYGAGFMTNEANPTLRRVTVYGNHARVTGGGLTLWNTSAYVEDALVYDNTAYYMAAGIWVHDGGTPILNQVTVTQNRCTSRVITSISAGGLGVSTGSNPILVNSILWDNFPTQIEFYTYTASNNVNIQYSTIENGEDGIETNSNGTFIWGLGNLDTDPLFTNPLNNDFTLMVNSPCIDAGTAELVVDEILVLNMLDDEYEMEAPDMGALEVSDPVAIDPGSELSPQAFALHQNYPNPFNPSTTIRFNLPDNGWVSMIVFDLLGREVSRLIDAEYGSGSHSVNWQATDGQGEMLDAGVYLYRISFRDDQGSEYQLIKKFSLLK